MRVQHPEQLEEGTDKMDDVPITENEKRVKCNCLYSKTDKLLVESTSDIVCMFAGGVLDLYSLNNSGIPPRDHLRYLCTCSVRPGALKWVSEMGCWTWVGEGALYRLSSHKIALTIYDMPVFDGCSHIVTVGIEYPCSSLIPFSSIFSETAIDKLQCFAANLSKVFAPFTFCKRSFKFCITKAGALASL